MKLYLVRHAKAGDRSTWTEPDELRPLSASGRRQADRLATRLVAAAPTALVSSPFTRCVQTLEPIADQLGLTVTLDERLREGARFEDTLELLAEASGGTVLCSHGDVIPELVHALVRRGMDVRSVPDWRKASVWVITRNAAGRCTRATVWPPPDSHK